MQYIHKRKMFLFLLVCAMVAGTPAFFVSADHTDAHTIEQLQVQISSLFAQITAFQQQIAQQSGGGQAWCHTFNTNLKIDSRGDDEEALETALAREGFSVEHSSNFELVFNEHIASAVTGFQEKYRDEILTPNGLKYGTGYVGKSTRKKLNQLYGCGATTLVPPTTPPIPTTTLGVQVISPNGGESWQIGKTYEIVWTQAQNTLVSISLENARLPATGDGSVYIKSIGDVNGVVGKNLYRWTVPNDVSASDGYRLSIGGYFWHSRTDERPTLEDDQSDSYFKIVSGSTQPSITILSPNGGESYAVGTSIPISFSTTLTDKQTPGITMQLYRGTPGAFGSSFVQTIVSNWIGGSPYQWQIPTTLTPGQYSIYVSALTPNIPLKEGGVYDYSDAPFTITSTVASQQAISVLSPNGGEVWAKNKIYTISWKSSGVDAFDVILDQRLEEGGDMVIAYGVKTNSYQWTVPDTLNMAGFAGQYKILVRKACSTPTMSCNDSTTSFILDESDNWFSVSDAGNIITVLSPNGGETFSQGSQVNIRWTSSGAPSYVGLNLLQNDNHIMSIGNIPNTGSYNWNVPTTVSGSGFKIRAYGDGVIDTSDAPFSIVSSPTTSPSIQVLSPNGGETLTQGNAHKITWVGGKDIVQIGLVKDTATNDTNPGGDPYLIVGWINTSASPNSSIYWDAQVVYDLHHNPLQNVTPGRYKIISVTKDSVGNFILWDGVANKPGVWDISDAPFTITSAALPNPQLTFTGTQNYTGSDGNPYVKYSLSVSNWSSYPNSMFTVAPSLPPCGLNNNSSRTWVNIYNATNNSYVYGFCALGLTQDLTALWFGIPQGTVPPQSVYVTINDRQTGAVYRSNAVTTLLPDLAISDIYNDAGKLSIKVQNIGVADAPIDTGHLYIWIDDQLKWTYSVSTWSTKDYRLVGGVTVVQPQVLTGTHKIKATIDPNGVIGETNENNNTLEKTVAF